jgi:uncharacterized membrane protein
MVLMRPFLLALILSLAAIGAPGFAHKEHEKARPPAVQPAASPPGAAIPPSEMQQQMEAHMEEMEAQAPKSFLGRLTAWFGRMHPFAVHFPIALFPVALVALILARRRGETVELIRALIVVAGAASVAAAILGWLNGGLTIMDTDPVLQWHRWLGTLLALLGGGVAWWAWRRRASVQSGAMVAVLSLVVVVLLVQGFLGASVTHGMDHLAF